MSQLDDDFRKDVKALRLEAQGSAPFLRLVPAHILDRVLDTLEKRTKALEDVQHWMADAHDDNIPCCFPRNAVNEALAETEE